MYFGYRCGWGGGVDSFYVFCVVAMYSGSKCVGGNGCGFYVLAN